MAPLPPLITPPPPGRRQNRRLIYGVAVLGVFGVAVGLMMTWGRNPPMIRNQPPPDRPPSEQKVLEKPTPLPKDLTLDSSYVGKPLQRREEVAQRPPFTQAPPGTAPAPPAAGTRPPAGPQGGSVPMPQPPQGLTPPNQPPGQPGPAQTTPKQQAQGTPKKKYWYAQESQAQQGDIMTAPFRDETLEEKRAKQESKLFPKAVRERPLYPEKVLYADQIVHGHLMQDVNSDIPGTVRIKVTRDVEDRFGWGHVLVPLDSVFLAKQEGQTSYGQTVIPMDVYMGIFPDGSAMQWTETSVGSAGGASGVPGRVNNHYGKLIAGAVLQAMVNIGVRAPFGSPGQGQYQPNLAQEYSENVAQSLGGSVQRIIQRELAVKPTITRDLKDCQPGKPEMCAVTVQFARNVSFMSEPVLISK